MFKFAGHRVIEELGSNGEISLYRVVRLNDNMRLLAKTTSGPHVGSRMIAAFQYEFDQLLQFSGAGAVEPVSLEMAAERPVLFLKDPGGSTLHQWMRTRGASLKFGELLEAAIAVSDCIHRLQQHHITLHEMTPLSFVLNDSLTAASIVDLRFCSSIRERSPLSMSMGRPYEVLPYLSPEQTGRMGRAPDYRSDYYSLGVILYEWFAKALPFQSPHLLDLVHLHLTAIAEPVHRRNRSIPAPLSEIIQKCMEKMPEARYASAIGIRMDLEECRVQFRVSGKVRSFPLATRDMANRSIILDELIARPAEQQKLLGALECAMAGAAVVVWVSGGAGTGKTPLVLKTLRQNIPDGCFFAIGTSRVAMMALDQPMWAQLIEELVSQLLSLNAVKGEIWRIRIVDALQGNGQLLTDVVPRLELFIGRQSIVPSLSPEEAQSRLQLTIQRFFQVFLDADQTFVIFLDGMERSDDHTNQLLSSLLENQEARHTLIVGSYREEELSSTHHLERWIKGLDEPGVRSEYIHLSNYPLPLLQEMLSKMFSRPVEVLDDLAAELHRKTEGNPLALRQYLNKAMERGLLSLDEQSGTWRWDDVEIRMMDVPEEDAARMSDSLDLTAKEPANMLGGEGCQERQLASEEALLQGDGVELAEFVVQAGVKAKRSGEMEAALDYLRQATTLLADSWSTRYRLTWQAFRERAEAEFLCGHDDDARVLLHMLVERAETDDDQAQACMMMVRLEMNRERHDQVIARGEMALKLLGIKPIAKPGALDLQLLLMKVQRKLRIQPVESLEQLPVMTDVRLSSAMHVYHYLCFSYAALERKEWLATILSMMEMTLDHGRTPEAAVAFAGYARFLHDDLHRYEEAYKWAKLSLHLSKSNPGLYARVSTSFLQCYKSWSRYEPGFLLAFSDRIAKSSMEYGDYWHAHYSVLVSSMMGFQFNQPLHHVYTRMIALSSEMDKGINPQHKRQTAMLAKLFTALTGDKEEEEMLRDPGEQAVLGMANDEQDHVFRELQTVYRFMTGYLFGDYEQARMALEQKLRTPNPRYPALDLLCHEYYYVLVLKELVPSGFARMVFIRKLYPYIRKLKRLAKRNPQSHTHQYLHAKAELASLGKQYREAETLYEAAMSAAREHGHLRDAAMIAECYAQYGILVGKLELARFYMNEAYETYQKWGAVQKAVQLQRKFGHLLPQKRDTATHSELIDYLSVAMSAQAISSEMEMEKLLPMLMRIMLQNAGADYGAIILVDEDKWTVEAYGTIHELAIGSSLLEEANDLVPTAVISYAARTREAVVINDAAGSSIFERDGYIKDRELKSALCLPMIHQGKLISFMYLENNQSTGVFTEDRLDVLKLLGSQCAISITNVRLYTGIRYLNDNLEEQVQERTRALERSMKTTSEALAEMKVYAERNRIAQEIHDIVGHSLTSTILQVEAAKRLLRKDMDGSITRLNETQDLIRHSLNEIRNSVHMLKEDRYYDINEAMNKLIQDTEHNAGIVVHVEADSIVHLSMIHKKAIFHALQEGLTNGIRHGSSNEFWFRLRDDGRKLRFSLQDNGIGFDHVAMGFGLSMMKDRIEQLRGTLSVVSDRNKGCLLSIELPYGDES
jgi:signal transduction histidine kinase/predicted ATPase